MESLSQNGLLCTWRVISFQADFLLVRGGGGEGGAEGQRGGKGCGDPGLAGQLSEGVKACSQTVGEGFFLQLIHTGAYNLQPVINHCYVWGRRLV